MELIFLGVFVYIIISAVKINSSKRSNNRSGNTNVPYQNRTTQGRPDKYRTINSHYSQATLQGAGNSRRNVQKDKAKSSDMSKQPTASDTVNSHNHSYEHKVEPIDEASVHEMFEDRKEAYRERKAQMKADLHKSSYSEVEQKLKSSNGGKYREIHRNSAKNGDNGYMPNRSEQAVRCSYCGANNIIPRNANVKYNCYFCREEL